MTFDGVPIDGIKMRTRRRREFHCPECASRNIQVGTAFNWSTFIPEDLRGTVRKARRECQCRICNHTWESTHPLAMDAPEPMLAN